MEYSFTNEDKLLLKSKGISEKQVLDQLLCFQTGFPFLRLQGAAGVGKGIVCLSDDEAESCIQEWNNYKKQGHRITKFVPASGAASRMFKNLFSFLDASYDVPTTDFEKKFFSEIHSFAFYDALNEACSRNSGKEIDALISSGCFKAVVDNLLNEKGLNYGQLPKGLLLFHRDEASVKTPVEEHLSEAALYASSLGEADIHFTVSSEHRSLFEKHVHEVLPFYEQKYGIDYHVSFSEQKPSTDTVSANEDNTPFRTDEGQLVFRPGGHGALLENLNDLGSDIVFIKNIDNVVPDRLKKDTVFWKQVLAGILVRIQKKAFAYLNLLESGKYNHNDLEDMIRFVRHELNCDYPGLKEMDDATLLQFLWSKLNRPIRVCGVVRNVGEPGGGPFLAYNPDGSVSLQILESSQIDQSNPEYVRMFAEGTHFNPVDLCCAIRDYKGNKFNLSDYSDPSTGFISSKSKGGRSLKALELPGLWNGAMSNWSTLMVEVPLSTFNPVKTVNDLLRPQHQ